MVIFSISSPRGISVGPQRLRRCDGDRVGHVDNMIFQLPRQTSNGYFLAPVAINLLRESSQINATTACQIDTQARFLGDSAKGQSPRLEGANGRVKCPACQSPDEPFARSALQQRALPRGVRRYRVKVYLTWAGKTAVAMHNPYFSVRCLRCIAG